MSIFLLPTYTLSHLPEDGRVSRKMLCDLKLLCTVLLIL
jgi:hypothetical protein